MSPGRAAARLCAGLFVAATGLPAPAADEPLKRILPPQDGASLCFRRVYDEAHLKRLPGQQTREALLAFRYRGDNGSHIESIQLMRRPPQPPLIFAGGCGWNPTSANIDTSGRRMIRSFTGKAGYDCIAVGAPGSAEEGGYFLIDLAADGKSATLHLDSPIAPWMGGRVGDHARHVDLSRDDRVFRLQRTEAAACAALQEETRDAP
ncbi:MAG: hypothetical protein AB7K35_09630 [Pseudorhodoplanes sp.]